MGMFDYIRYEMECPVCKHTIKGFQSKDKDCELEMLDFWEVDYFYSVCDYCGTFVEFMREIPREAVPIEYYDKRVNVHCTCEFHTVPKYKCPIHDLGWSQKEDEE